VPFDTVWPTRLKQCPSYEASSSSSIQAISCNINLQHSSPFLFIHVRAISHEISKPNNAHWVYKSKLYTPYTSYMFRPLLMWPSSGRCISRTDTGSPRFTTGFRSCRSCRKKIGVKRTLLYNVSQWLKFQAPLKTDIIYYALLCL
jgi:hypothetical protein